MNWPRQATARIAQDGTARVPGCDLTVSVSTPGGNSVTPQTIPALARGTIVRLVRTGVLLPITGPALRPLSALRPPPSVSALRRSRPPQTWT